MHCKLCEQDKKPAKSHVIPEAFFRGIKIDSKELMMRSGYDDALPKRTPIGVYDQTILCNECEASFNTHDDYGSRVLGNERDKFFKTIRRASGALALQAVGVDAKKLLGFFLSMLWRASVSSHIFYSRVQLGSFEAILKNYIQVPHERIPECFDAFLYRWIPPHTNSFVAKSILDPVRTKIYGVNLYKFYLGGFVILIKVDSRSLPSTLGEALLSKSDEFVVLMTEMHNYGDLATIVGTAERSQANLAIKGSKRKP